MNISPHITPTPLATSVNPPTDLLRHENTQRPVITAPTQTNGSPPEKGTADKHKAFNQSNESFNFIDLQKSAEENANKINANSEQGNQEQTNQENSQGAQENAQSSSEPKPESTPESNSAENTQPRSQEDSKQEKLETAQQQKEIQQLEQRDQEVRTHELAHARVGGDVTGAPVYEFEMGPNGKKYAVEGEVSVDLSTIAGDPQATITKMEKVHAAALAPVEPSAQDMKVASQATESIAQAKSELSALALEQKEDPDKALVDNDNNSLSVNEQSSAVQSDLFDQQMQQTINAQEAITTPTVISTDVQERSQRIEGYYSGITQAYEKPTSYQFQLTA